MIHYYKNLSETTQGIILMSVGALLLLHTLGIFTHLLTNILVIISLIMIGVGFVQANLYKKIMKRVHEKSGK